MQAVFTHLVRALTAWAWRDEVAARESIAVLKELHATPGKMEAHIEQRPEIAHYVAACLAQMVVKSPNYTEMKFTAPSWNDGSYLIVHIQKITGKSPHDLRVAAERERDELREKLAEWGRE